MRPKLTLVAAVIGLIGLVGCANQQPLEAIDVRAITAVQLEIKRQIGVYIAAAQSPPTVNIDGKVTPVSAIPDAFWCGKGDIGLAISSVKAELTTTLDNSLGISAAFSIPANLVTVGPSAGYKRDVTSTQTLDYNLWPWLRPSRRS
jgi:hypothetical protein